MHRQEVGPKNRIEKKISSRYCTNKKSFRCIAQKEKAICSSIACFPWPLSASLAVDGIKRRKKSSKKKNERRTIQFTQAAPRQTSRYRGRATGIFVARDFRAAITQHAQWAREHTGLALFFRKKRILSKPTLLSFPESSIVTPGVASSLFFLFFCTLGGEK